MSDSAPKPDQQNLREPDRTLADEETSATEARRVLLEEIRTELKTQSGLKKEILNELKPDDLQTRVLEWTRHPVLLLLLGSLFGGWLSSCYQEREWKRQQDVLSEKQRIEKKASTRDEVTDAIVEAYSASESAVRPVFYENATTFAAGETERAKEWAEASKKWQHARLKFLQKLDLYFTNPDIKKKFVEIIESTNKNGNSLFVEVNNVLGTVKNQPDLLNESGKPVEQQSQEYIALKNRIRENILAMTTEAMGKTRELRELMQREIEQQSSSNNRPSRDSRDASSSLKYSTTPR